MSDDLDKANNPEPDAEDSADLDLDGLDLEDLDDSSSDEASGDAPDAANEDLAFDDSGVPQELRPKWDEYTKGFKSAYTKKTQALAELRKDYERRLSESGEAAYKAAQLDQVLQVPGVVEALRAAYEGSQGRGASSSGQGQSTPQDGQVDPVSQRISQLEAQIRREAMIREVDRFKQEKPDFEKYLDGMMAAFKENSQLDPWQAYAVAKGRALDARMAKARAAKKHKQAPQVESPQPDRRDVSANEAQTFEEAFERAKREHGGI